jgi:hypothetical protein
MKVEFKTKTKKDFESLHGKKKLKFENKHLKYIKWLVITMLLN